MESETTESESGFYLMVRFNAIYSDIRRNNRKKLMEIGVYRAARSLQMLKVAGKDAEFVGFDYFEDMTYEVIKNEVSMPVMPFSVEKVKSVLSDYNHYLIKGDTKETLPKFITESNFTPDLMFIDGGHSLETTLSDLKCCLLLLNERNVLYVDDYSEKSTKLKTKEAVDSLPSKYRVELIDTQDFAGEDYEKADLKLAKIIKI